MLKFFKAQKPSFVFRAGVMNELPSHKVWKNPSQLRFPAPLKEEIVEGESAA
jgi:hypothetical protein